MRFKSLSEFEKDLKHLLKKYRSLNSDLEDIKIILRAKPDEQPPYSFRIDNLGITTCVIKIKKIASDNFKGRGINSGFRLVYAWFKEEQKIIFIELYHKSDKGNEDRQRILENFK
jgi:mRNA-degrading endonuclease RelE of RelBE toxin-antitoxin system